MHRFFCSPQNISSQKIIISDKNELHHIRDVLRLKDKDKVVVLDGQGSKFICQIDYLDKKHTKLDIIEKHSYDKESLHPRITIACALPKKSKIDFIVEKLTEIGVERIILLKTERTEVDFKDYDKKLEKLKKIAESALKQSGNVFLPKIDILNFEELLKIRYEEGFSLALIPNLEYNTQNIKSVLKKISGNNILVAIGPEGDFSKNEIKLAKEAGFVAVSLGDTILKVDTAAIITVSFIKLYLSRE